MKFTRAIVKSPAPNFADGITTSSLGRPDYKLALLQHQAYCAALEECGLTLTKLDADENFPDSVFVEDTAVLTDRCAIVANPGAATRTGETESIRIALNYYFSAIHSIEPPGTLDGGDICQADDHFIMGISERTNEAGAQQLTDIVAQYGFSSSLVDIRMGAGGSRSLESVPSTLADGCFLHLKSAIAYLGDSRLVVTQSLASRPEFQRYELITVPEAESYAANCIRVNDHVLIAAGHRQFAASLKDLGYKTIALDMSEFQKMDGGLSCLSLRF